MVKFVHLHSSIHTFFERAGRKIFLTLLGYNVAKGCTSPRNSTWFTRPFLLVRGWGLGTRLRGKESLANIVLPYIAVAMDSTSLCSCLLGFSKFVVC